MTPEAWSRSTDPEAMLQAVAGRATSRALWRLAAVIGRRFCATAHYTMQLAVECAEAIASGTPHDDAAVAHAWFNAFGTGAYVEDGGSAAEDMLAAARPHVAAAELAAVIREVLGDPIAPR